MEARLNNTLEKPDLISKDNSPELDDVLAFINEIVSKEDLYKIQNRVKYRLYTLREWCNNCDD